MTLAINEVMLAISSSLAASIVAKVTMIMALGLFAVCLARGSRAAVRHALLAAMFGVMLLLPIASFVMPPLHVGIPVGVESRTALPALVTGVEQMSSVAVADDPGDGVISAPQLPRISVAHLLLAGWAAGAVLFLLPVVIGLWQIRSLRRSGLPWRRGQSVVEALALDAGIQRRVEVLLHEALPGPMTCGVVHPAVALPRDAENWNEEDLSRALVHELEHVRRGDSVSRCFARIACAVYWFHPLVWIAWRKLVLDAERSCDDAVLRHSEATAYADQLVELAKRLSAHQRSPLLAMADRTDLATRVRSVLDVRQRRGRAGAFSLGLTTTAAMVLVVSMSSLILVAMPQAAPAQTVTAPRPDAVSVTPDPVRLVAQARPAAVDRTVPEASAPPAFEVTSVRPYAPGVSGHHFDECSGDRYISSGLIFGNVLQWTFELQGSAGTEFLRSIPESIRHNFYDIQAKAAAPIESESQCRLMVQALLADRFKLAFHYEDRDVELFDLVVARGGPKMRKALPTDEGTDINIVVNGRLLYTEAPIRDADERARTKGMTMEELAQRLPTTAPRPIADKTGLEGRYKIDLRYSTTLQTAESQDPVDPPFDAALAQLGLRLEKHKGSVKVPVLDHIEPPDAN